MTNVMVFYLYFYILIFTEFVKTFNLLDINECQLKLHNCDSDASCINEMGTFKCKCNDGFKIDDSNNCIGTLRIYRVLLFHNTRISFK
jgi:hypothetical protein